MLAVVVLVIAAATAMFWPLRTTHTARAHGSAGPGPVEIASDAKLGELHDLELDYRLGKLSDEDYRELNETVRAEAVEAMRRSGA
jgi:hypothetical protein